MARTRSSSSKWRFCNPSYYLKRPKRLAFLLVTFVCVSLVVWDRQTLLREHEDELAKLNSEVVRLRSLIEEVNDKPQNTIAKVHVEAKKEVDDPIDAERREKVKEAMTHAWSSYEKYAWGQDELQPQTKGGINSFGGLGATLIDSLDTLYIMGLDEQFQKAKEWVEKSLDFNKNYDASVFETTIRLRNQV